jgi:hypothetical protein
MQPGNDRLCHVAATQEIRMQGVRDPSLDGVLGGGQSLAQHLATEYLRTAYVAAVAAEDVVLYALQPEERDQVFEYRVHRKAVMPARGVAPLVVDPAAVDRYAGPAHEYGVVAGEK